MRTMTITATIMEFTFGVEPRDNSILAAATNGKTVKLSGLSHEEIEDLRRPNQWDQRITITIAAEAA